MKMQNSHVSSFPMFDASGELLDGYIELPPLRDEDQRHPYARFEPFSLNSIREPEFLIDNVLSAGTSLIVGARGVGKTTCLVPLLAKCAHLCAEDDPLKPKIRRRVIYISEDIEQVKRVMLAYFRFSNSRFDDAEINDWFKLVAAARISVEEIANVASVYVGLANVNRGRWDFEALPVVVFDTRSACFSIENEDSNSEAGRLISILRQRFSGLPVLVISHVPKSVSRKELSQMTARGAGAQEADVQQVSYLFEDEKTGKRYLHISEPAKKRFESDVEEIEFRHIVNEVDALNVLGEPVKMRVGYCEAAAIRVRDRLDDREERTWSASEVQETRRRADILVMAEQSRARGNPLSRTGLSDAVGGRATATRATVRTLLAESWLVEVSVPPRLRANQARQSFVIALDDFERHTFLSSGQLPLEKATIPPAWLRPDASAKTG